MSQFTTDSKFNQYLDLAKTKPPIKVAVVNPIDEVSFLGALEAYENKLITPFLFGKEEEIKNIAIKYKKNIDTLQIINCQSIQETIDTAILFCKNNTCQALMKGKVHTDELMAAVVNKETGLRTTTRISHVFVLSLPNYPKLFGITDSAINISPDLTTKEHIIKNSVSLFNKLISTKPNIAIISATETPNPKMQSSLDAATLANSEVLKSIANIEGPFAIDNILSKESAEIKNIKSNLIENTDIFIMPNIESGNILTKSLVYLAHAEVAGLVMGATVPIILTSRADTASSRLLSCVLASLYINK
jgi:phosphotransacetylase